jgi:LPPG:FO 2-phospho-L-lactate transferase
MNVVCLVGGVGGAKLAHGLAQILEPGQLTVIVNTGDDLWYYGLRVCPDLDTVMYTLAGIVDPVNGWGIEGDTRHTLDGLARYGMETWFGVGDQDLATHLLRTQWLRDGLRLSEVTMRLAERLGIQQRLLPMTDALVATKVNTVEHGELDFQTYFVKMRWQPTVESLRIEGVENAQISPEVAQAFENADIILFGPSNPWLSILPILSVPGLKDMLIAKDVPRVALTPVVQGEGIKGPVSKLMRELGYKQSAEAIVEFYRGIITGFVYDERDLDLNITGINSIALNTIMRTNADRETLARQILDWTAGKSKK